MGMSIRHEILKRRLAEQKRVSLVKATLARSVRLRIGEELEIDPLVKTFHTPLLTDNEKVKNELRNHADEIAGRIAVGRTVEIEFDETVEPPEVVITLGPTTPPE